VPRHHVAVALLVPRPAARDLAVLRAALGARDLERVPPHLTLVPPCSLRGADLPAALAVLRAAAGDGRPLRVRLGPVATFSPVTPTVHLAVGPPDAGDAAGNAADDGSDGDDQPDALVELRRLRDAVDRAPFARQARHPFVPHVTLLEQAPLHRIRAARLALAAVAIPTCLGRITLLSEGRGAGGDRRWVPLADVDLGGVRTLGRGGLPIELSRGTLLDPEARAALDLPVGSAADAVAAPDDAADADDGAGGPGPVVVVARMAGEVVGAAWGPDRRQRRSTDLIDGDVLGAAWLDARSEAGSIG
jgi:2'-5' RNA ligase